jgi:hypothetical protein
MKVELDDKQKQQLEGEMNSNPIRKWMVIKEFMKFEIGDVLIRKQARYKPRDETEWITENINSDNKMAQRYVYIHEDEFGIGYIKQLRVANGTLGQEIWSMTDFDYKSTRFEVDPEFAEATFLGGDFDIKKIHSQALEQRKIITKVNRKKGQKFKTLQGFNDFFDKLKVGDKYWTTQDFTGRYKTEVVINEIVKVPMSAQDIQSDYMVRCIMECEREMTRKGEAFTPFFNSSYTYKVSTSSRHRDNRYVFEYRDYILYTQEPAIEEKKK